MHLADVASQLRKAGLTINVTKCQFGLKQVELTGYIVGGGTLQINPEKDPAVAEFPAPKTQRQLQGCLGMTGWYQQYPRSFFP